MEQAKEFLRQVIKYRFWISITVAALFATIAYLVGSKPVRDATLKEVGIIKAAETDVKQYTSPSIPNAQYKPIVEEKTAVLTTDVNAAWKTLFDRQAPLLTWPETVQDRFRKWGRKWPEDEDKGKVLLAIVDYMEAYPSYVTMVYKSFKPFDYETGEGIVVAAPEQGLLRPSVFQTEKPPDLGKVWSAQERLWIQRTLLEVVAQVNKNAKDWDTATIKQIDALEVGSSVAQDQRSVAKGDQLTEADKIYPPGEEAPPEEAAGGGGGGMGGKMGEMMQMQMMGGAGRRMGGMMGGGGALAQDGGSVSYVKSENDKGQYKIMPVLLTVLIDQDRIQDLLIELENSPMSIQVMDLELAHPTSKVTKPEKGTAAYGGFAGGGMMGGMGGMMSSMMMRGGMGRMSGFGGRASEMMGQMGQMMGQRGGMMGGGYPGMMGGGAVTPERKGIDKRNVDSKKGRTEKEKAALQSKGPSLFDPYFDIIQMTVYGQARFFNPPPAQPAAEPSPGETAAAPVPPASGVPPAVGPAAPGEPAVAGSAAPKVAPASSPSAPAEGSAAKSTTSPPADGTAAKTGNGEAAKPAAPPAKTTDSKTTTPKS